MNLPKPGDERKTGTKCASERKKPTKERRGPGETAQDETALVRVSASSNSKTSRARGR